MSDDKTTFREAYRQSREQGRGDFKGRKEIAGALLFIGFAAAVLLVVFLVLTG